MKWFKTSFATSFWFSSSLLFLGGKRKRGINYLRMRETPVSP
jgi:hypothetical protein